MEAFSEGWQGKDVDDNPNMHYDYRSRFTDDEESFNRDIGSDPEDTTKEKTLGWHQGMVGE